MHDVTQTALDRLIASASLDAMRLVNAHHSPGEFVRKLESLLHDTHTEAVVIGRIRAGDDAPPDQDDRKFASVVMIGEGAFLKRFQSDLEAGRYLDEDGQPKIGVIQNRALMYFTRAKGTANEAWALTLDGPFQWKLGQADHCGDCPELAANGPYHALEIPTYPRAGETACIFNCTCTLIAPGGLTSFE